MLAASAFSHAAYTNFESSHVHPVDITPAGGKLLAVNTPDAVLEVFTILGDGSLTHDASIPVGLEPVTVRARTDTEAWVVNLLSDTVTIVDLGTGIATGTLAVGDEPTDVVFAMGRAFVTASQEDAVKVFSVASLATPPATIDLFGREPRALAVNTLGTQVYGVFLKSGNQTTVVNASVAHTNSDGLQLGLLAGLGLNPTECDGAPPAYPPLPSGISRNPLLTDPPPFLDPNGNQQPGVPKVGLIVGWNQSTGKWEDDAGQDWTHCLPFRLPDHDLFTIDATSLTVSYVDHLGTSLFEVAVNPDNDRIYVPHTDARNRVRFEHPLGLQGHMVDNRMAIIDPNFVITVDLNSHINRSSNPATNLAERQASISQPGMMVWKGDGSVAYLTAIGSRKLFAVSGSSLLASTILGPDRSNPQSVTVDEGPTGVALHEGKNRVYVLSRFASSISVIEASTLSLLTVVSLHDPSSDTIKQGRRFLYDGIDTSGHGDAACASCHLFGGMDGLAWDLGNPAGGASPYTTTNDNVRFILSQGGGPSECNPLACAAHAGFDPQKGPMATQTLRRMLEPLHWRGDRATMNSFNKAFVSLMGTADIGPIMGEPAGLTATDMELFRQFTLGVHFHPNPNRPVNDILKLSDGDISLPGHPFTGNPAQGEDDFSGALSCTLFACTSCHALPFGTAGGQAGGVAPVEPTSSVAAALSNGTQAASPHSDLKVPHLRNMYKKFGPLFGTHTSPPPEARSGFGYTHDGSISDLGTLMSLNRFRLLDPQQIKDIAAFMFAFPTGVKPAVGRNLTLPAGLPPTGTTAEEGLLDALINGLDSGDPLLGDLTDGDRHCELVATTLRDGRIRSYHLSGGNWVTDVAGETPITTTDLRQNASGPVSFLCTTIGSGPRLGGDRDEDTILDGDDCAAADPGSWASVMDVQGLTVTPGVGATAVGWQEQSVAAGPDVLYDLVGGSLQDLHAGGLDSSSCQSGGLTAASYNDTRGAPPLGDGFSYLTRARNVCGNGGYDAAGVSRSSLDSLPCP